MTARKDLVPAITTLLVGAVLTLGSKAVFGSPDCGPPAIAAEASPASDTDALHLVVLSSSNKGAVMAEMACTFERTDPTVDGKSLDVVVESEPSGSALDKLSSGSGPRPDVWTPASSSWVAMLRTLHPDWISPAQAPSIAQSPQVIAMPKPIAVRLGWPEHQIGWKDVLDLATDPATWARVADPSWGAFKLGKTNPLYSTSGLNATVATYAVATGRSSDLTLGDLSKPAALDFVRGVESAVVHYAPTSIDFLRNLRARDERGEAEQYVSAVLLEEKSVWDYNEGNPSADPQTLGDQPRPGTPLVAFYPPEGAIVADHPYVILTADWVSDADRVGANAFLRFLEEPAQQARFQQLGFRDRTGRPGPQIDEANGLIATQPTRTLGPPGGDVMLRIRSDWNRYRKRARLLMLIDVSGSMNSIVPGTDRTKLALAKTAALRALRQLGPDDDVGLWTFASASGGYVENVPIEPLGKNGETLRATIRNLRASGGTHLYAALEAAAATMRDHFDPTKINGIILLSDGVNEDPANDDRAAAIRAVAPPGPDTEIRVFTIAYGDEADVATLDAIATSSLGTAYDATDATTIERVFDQVVANF